MMEEPAPPLIEIEIVKDKFISGVGRVEILGPNARVWFFVDQASLMEGHPERLVVEKLVIPIEAIPSLIKAVLVATCKRVTIPPWLDIFEAPPLVGRH